MKPILLTLFVASFAAAGWHSTTRSTTVTTPRASPTADPKYLRCCGNYFPVCGNYFPVCGNVNAEFIPETPYFSPTGTCWGGIVAACQCIGGRCASLHEFRGAGRGTTREGAIDAARGDAQTSADPESLFNCEIADIPFVAQVDDPNFGLIWRATVDLVCTRIY